MMSRIEKIKQNLCDGEALLIKSAANRRYLTGFPSSAGAVLITRKCARLLIDFRYFEKARAEVKTCEVVLCRSVYDEIKASGITRLYLENEDVSLAELSRMEQKLLGTELLRDPKFDKLIADMRAVKDEGELMAIRRAQKITDEGFSYILGRIEEGRTERDIMLDLEFFMRRQGSEGVAFDFIVVSGKNSSLPHGVPTERKIEKGDFITMDFGARVEGYCSDMTRTVAVGNVSEEQSAVYETVLSAQKAALAEIKAGRVCCDIDKISRDIIENAGYTGAFGHGLGHSVGLEIHENPSFNTVCETTLKAGNIMTVEPGIYLENRFGVRIEDMVYVTEDGCINLTRSEKKLIIL